VRHRDCKDTATRRCKAGKPEAAVQKDMHPRLFANNTAACVHVPTNMTVANSNVLLAYYGLLVEWNAAAKRHRLFLRLSLRFRNVDGM
jgi:hypothetical protein